MLYVRHGRKEYKNGRSDSFRYDPHITRDGLEEVSRTTVDYCERYGIPERIVCSPYARTRETAIEMRDTILQVYSRDVQVYVDRLLSEHLGKRPTSPGDFREETSLWNPPLGEDSGSHGRRMRKVARSISDGTWVITHGRNVREIHRLLNGGDGRYPGELEGIYRDGDLCEEVLLD